MATSSSLANAAAPATTAEQKIQTATQQTNTANPKASASSGSSAQQGYSQTNNPTTTRPSAVETMPGITDRNPTEWEPQSSTQQSSIGNVGHPAGPNTQPTTNPQNQTAPQAAGLSTITTPSGRQSTLQDPSTLASNLQNLLNEWKSQATTQQENKIDYNVQQQTNELQRQVEDAQVQFKEQQDQIARSEANARDNAALYAEARGDKGGIGQAQYNAIQNTAAKNRLAVAQAQTKLATDVNRQISDLRAQGDFEKADAALQVAQNYLSQLMTLQQWAANYGISYDQFQEAMFEWQNEYDMSMAQLLGQFSDGTRTLQGQQYYDQQLANAANALIEAGVAPTTEMLAALGISGDEADAFIKAKHLKSAEDVLKGKTNTGGGYVATVADWYPAGSVYSNGYVSNGAGGIMTNPDGSYMKAGGSGSGVVGANG